MRTGRVRVGIEFLAVSVFAFRLAAQEPASTASVPDLAENGVGWSTQSYWQDPNILQRYSFSANVDDKVAGAASVEVHLEVAANRPQPLVELRFAPPQPVDLSQAEAFEVSLKLLGGNPLKPRDVFFCSPDFKKLAIASWPAGLVLTPGADWQRVVFDLTEVRILDKENPNGNGEYNRRDVAILCLNFLLQDGAVDQRLLIDGLQVCALPRSQVLRKSLADGSYVFTTPAYRAVVGRNGYLQSLRAGATEFLRFPATPAAASASGCYVENDPAKGTIALTTVAQVGRYGVEAKGEKVSLRYLFREQDFDITLQQSFHQAGCLQFTVSDEVAAALDGPTDRAIRVAAMESGYHISGRLMTKTGGVLVSEQNFPGYSRMSAGPLPGNLWSWRFMAWGEAPAKLTLRPLGKPGAADAVGSEIHCANPDFLMPAGQPVRFDISVTSYAAGPVSGQVTFQVRDYLTKQVAGERVTPFQLDPGGKLPVPTDVKVAAPGTYRAAVVIADEAGHRREVECVFTYAFTDFKPALTRQPDFKEFWKATLAELAAIPMDAQIVPMPELGTDDAEVFKVSLATLGGRRAHCWYWKPRKPGRYPAVLRLPSSGIYPWKADATPHGADHCGMWIAIHGLPVDLDLANLPQDPVALNYWTYGIESPKTSMWRTIYASLVRAMDFLSSREEVDPKRIMVFGGSQGGGLTMVLAGLDRRVAFASPAHSGLCRLDWTVLHRPGFWPFAMEAKPAAQTPDQFLQTLSYFDAANFTPDIACPVFAEVSLLDTVTASGTQFSALAQIQPGLLELVCDPWTSHESDARCGPLRDAAITRWIHGENPIQTPIKPTPPAGQ